LPNHTSLIIFLARKSQEHFGIHFNKDTNVEFECKANQDNKTSCDIKCIFAI